MRYLILCLCALISNATHAAIFVQPNAADSGLLGNAGSVVSIEKAIDGSGLSVPISEASSVNVDDGLVNLAFHSGIGTPTGTLTFDFGSAIEIGAFHLWNGPASGDHSGVDAFSLEFFSEANASGTSLGSVGGLNAAGGPSSGTFVAETFTFTPIENVRSFNLNVLSNHESKPSIVIYEIGVTAVPEPEFYAVLSAACLAVWALWRRRFRTLNS